MSTKPVTCPKCGQPVPADAPGLLCPRCLVAGGFSGSKVPPAESNDPDATLHIVIPEDAALPPGARRKLGKYELVQEIACGGMGIVYKAWQPGLERFVAVKTIRSGLLATPADVERFQREAKAAAKLRHPHIVAIHEIGEQDGQHYFAMDYVPGDNLATLARQQPFLPEQTAQITAAVAAAIHYAHQQSVLHRDLKPANVILSPDGPRVLDFGLARLQQDDSQLTQTGTPMGSPCYMSPEQAAGKIRTLDARTDVYALGAMLYELLTGRPPFQAASVVETLQLVQQTDPVPPRRLNPTLPADVETICLKCLEKEPQKRYQSAQELSEELGRFVRDEPIQARPVGRAERAWRWCRRNPRVASLSAATVLLLLAVAIGSPIAVFLINRARNAEVVERKRAVTSARALGRNLYVSDMRVAWQAIDEQRVGQARELVERYLQPQPGEEDLRGFEWRLLWQRSRPNHDHSFNAHRGWAMCAVFSPDGSWLASASEDRMVIVRDLATKKRLRTLEGFEGRIDTKALAFSPDGHLLAAKGGKRLQVWRTDTWQSVAVLQDMEANDNRNNAVVFSPDGSTLATRVSDGVAFWNTVTWERTEAFLYNTKRLLGGPGHVLGTVLTYSADGQFLAVSDWNELQIHDARRPMNLLTNLTGLPVVESGRILSVAFSQKYVAASYRHGVIALWERQSWKQTALVKVNQSFLLGLAFSPDGSLLAAGGSGSLIQVWDVETLAASSTPNEGIAPRITFRGHTAATMAVAFAPDGRTVASASADGTIKLWNALAQPDRFSLSGSTASVAFSSDDTLLAAVHSDGWLHLWDVAKRVQIGTIETAFNTNVPAPIAFAPNRRQVALGLTNGDVQLWQLSSPPVRFHTVTGDGNSVEALGFSPDPQAHRLLVLSRSGSGYRYYLHNLHDNAPPLLIQTIPVRMIWTAPNSFAFSPDGKLLAVIDAGRGINLLNVTDGSKRRLGDDWEYRFGCVAFSPDGLQLAAGAREVLSMWDVKSGHKQLVPQNASMMTLYRLAFSPDGKTLLTFDLDDTARFWNVALRREILTVPKWHNSGVSLSPSWNALALPIWRNPETYDGVELYTVPTLAEIDAVERSETGTNSKLSDPDGK